MQLEKVDEGSVVFFSSSFFSVSCSSEKGCIYLYLINAFDSILFCEYRGLRNIVVQSKSNYIKLMSFVSCASKNLRSLIRMLISCRNMAELTTLCCRTGIAWPSVSKGVDDMSRNSPAFCLYLLQCNICIIIRACS